jgi:hypothetical protein
MNGAHKTPCEQWMFIEGAAQMRQQLGALRIDVEVFRAIQRRHDANDVSMRLADRKARFAVIPKRLFDEGDTVPESESHEQLLRSLPDKIPSQMTVDDDRRAVAFIRSGGVVAHGDAERNNLHDWLDDKNRALISKGRACPRSTLGRPLLRSPFGKTAWKSR